MIRAAAELATGTVCFGLNTLPLDTILLPRLRTVSEDLLCCIINPMWLDNALAY